MKIRMLQGCLIAGEPVAEGAVLDVPAGVAVDLCSMGRALALNDGELREAVEVERRRVVGELARYERSHGRLRVA